MPATPRADVVTVPDFRGPNAALFEARTLLFLGSWRENAGTSRDWPLHLACIGEPPPRVRALAERCGAALYDFAPFGEGHAVTRNKLRGFEVQARTERLLLLDTDVVTLGDPRAALAIGEDVAVARAANHRMRSDEWERVYRALGEALPTQRMTSQRADVADRIPRAALHGEHHREPMLPYWNTGVLLVRWERAAEVRKRWEANLERLAERFADEPGSRKSLDDQAGFAPALLWLQRQGIRSRELPHALHANWILLLAGAVRLDEIALYHAVHLYRLGPESAGQDWEARVAAYTDFVLGHVYPRSLRGRLARARSRLAGERRELREIRALCARIGELTRRYVAPDSSAAASHAAV